MGFSLHKRRVCGVMGAAVVATAVILVACAPPSTQLEKVKARGELRVLSRQAATTFYEGPAGPAGLEYELLRRFADELGVELVIETPDTLQEILDGVREGRADLAAAGLTVTEARARLVRFAPPYQHITQQLVYRRGGEAPRSLVEAARRGDLEVVADSSHAELLRRLKARHPDLTWRESPETDSMELLQLVAENLIDYTIVDSNELALNRRFFPNLEVALDVSEPQPLAWAFALGEDDSLYRAAQDYFRRLESSGDLARLVQGYYRHVDRYDYAGTRTFLRHVKRRLPRYRELFEAAAERHGLDWKLLAAVAYQESHWNPHAVSPTGVRGMMMLTRATARHLGIRRRTDPVQSIEGGARYLARLIERIPAHIPEPDRTWLALAAYNVGFGHLEDARDITRRRGGNPDAWASVRENLPLLRKRKWYRTTRYGYARGNEPVRYVENIRSYYDILDWYLQREQPAPPRRPVLAIATPAL